MNSISRRRFLKIGAATAGVAATAGALSKFTQQAVKISSSVPEKGVYTIPTYCDLCFWKCNAIATVKDGKLWKIVGNPIDPMSKGRLCPRGTGGVGSYYDPDRLRKPLMRKNNRGQEEWVEVTWDEAFTFIADKMKRIKSEYGPEAVALFSHGIGGNFFKHLMKAYGTPNLAAPSFAQCRGPRDAGFRLTFGEDVGSPERTDIENSKFLVLIGSHLGENMHNTQVQEFATAIERGTKLLVVDPRHSVAASKADWWFPIKPGTDIALILAWINVIVNEELYDKDYIGKYAIGLDKLIQAVANKTPEWAYPITGIKAELIRETAREMARYKPATLIHPGRHVTWYGDDSQRSRAIAILNALMGSWGRKGGFFSPVSMDIASYPYPEYPHSEKGKVDNPDNKYPFAHETITTGIREATISGKPYPVKGWFVYATNLMFTLPNEDETIKAIQNLDLMVVVETQPSEITGWADVVLPEATYLERYDDLNVEFFKEPFISIRQPVLEPAFETKPGWWMAKKLSEKLGLEKYFPWKNIEEYLDTRLKNSGYSLEQLKKVGLIKGDRQPIYFEEGVTPEFPTPSGKIELYSEQLAAYGLDPVPRYRKHEEPPPGYYRLLFGRSPVHSFGRTQSNPILFDMMKENEVWINKFIADKLELKSGDYVILVNQDGVRSNKVMVKSTERIRQDCVYIVHGFGHTSKGFVRSRGLGASDNQLVTKYKIDPIMGGTAQHLNFVTIERAA